MHDFNPLAPFGESKPVTARAVTILFGGLLVTLSALTTAAFFYRYAGQAFTFLVGDLSPWLSAAVGVLCYEVASLTWAWLRAHDADTAGQLAVSNIAAWLTMAGGLVATCIYFALTAELISGQLDATAETVVSIAGGLLIVAGIAGNFAAGHIYRINAATHAAAAQAAEIRAMQTGAAHTANREATYATLAQTLEQIRRQLPDTANRQGAANAAQYIGERFTVTGGQGGQEAAETARPLSASANGQHQ